jgi:hypothetical protein
MQDDYNLVLEDMIVNEQEGYNMRRIWQALKFGLGEGFVSLCLTAREPMLTGT